MTIQTGEGANPYLKKREYTKPDGSIGAYYVDLSPMTEEEKQEAIAEYRRIKALESK